MNLQRERVRHLTQRPSRRSVAVRLHQHVLGLIEEPGEHAFDTLSLQAGQLMVELVGQRRQRPDARTAEHDLPHQVTSQHTRQHGAGHSQSVRRRLPCASRSDITQHRQLPCYPCLQPFQQRHDPGQRRIRHWLTEDSTDLPRDLVGSLAIGWAHLSGGAPDSSLSRLPQRALLIIAEHQRCQLLAARISELLD